MKDIPYGYITICSIIAIAILESINMITLKHNGNILSLCIVVISGLGGYTIKTLELQIKEKFRKVK